MTDNMTPKDPAAEGLPIDEINLERPQPGVQAAVVETRDAGPIGPGTSTQQRVEGVMDLGEATGRGEGVGQALETEGMSQGQIVRRRFIRHRGAIFGLVTLVTIALLAFTSMGLFGIKGWWRYQDISAYTDVVGDGSPTMHLPRWLGGEGFAIGLHPFGQDTIGLDNFALVMRGVQTSLLVMTVMGLIALLIGVTIGSVSGFYRGRIDMLLMRFTDMIITLPVIVIGAVLGRIVSILPTKLGWSADAVLRFRSYMPLLLAVSLGCILWTGLARLTRSEFLGLREREFVDSARVAGASNFRIITKHILPNAIGVIIVNTTLLMSASVVLESALSFLGFGITDPNVSLGKLISLYQSAFATRPWLFWWPGLFIISIALSVNFIGDGLRDAFDPRTKRIPSKRQMDKAEKLAAPSFEEQEASDARRAAGTTATTAEEGSK